MKDTFLLIEDEDIGKSFKELIEHKIPNSEVYWVKNGTDALGRVENSKIKIVIFDQKLIPTQELGLNIMRKIKEKDKDAIGILLSAYSAPNDAIKALSEGIFNFYVNKQNIKDEFISTIMEALQIYQINLEERAHEYTYLGKISCKTKVAKIPIPFVKHKVFLAEKKLVDPFYVFPENWENLYIINAGEEQCITQKVEMSNKVKIEKVDRKISSVEANSSKINDLLSLSMSKQLSIDRNASSEKMENKICEVKKNYRMPDIPEDISKTYLSTIKVQSNQIYNKYKCKLAIQCPFCGAYTYECYTTYVPTGHIKYRKLNIYSDNHQDVVEI